MPKISALLFDLDGTLLDTAPEFSRAINMMREARGLTPLDVAEISPWVGFGTQKMMEKCLDLRPEDADYEATKTELLGHYMQTLGEHTVWMPGMDSIVAWWEGQQRPWGIVTNRTTALTTPLLKALQLSHRPHVVVCADTTPHAKPHPAPMHHAANSLKAPAQSMVYVGDAGRDMVAGRAAQMHTISALFGYLNPIDPHTDWPADYSIDAAEELAHYLQQYDNSLKPY